MSNILFGRNYDINNTHKLHIINNMHTNIFTLLISVSLFHSADINSGAEVNWDSTMGGYGDDTTFRLQMSARLPSLRGVEEL